eukprot:Amastigsp_a508823_1387.p3 type:complete len:338 gc:universal Amastigsp_a508823_1387:325-1338(+)
MISRRVLSLAACCLASSTIRSSSALVRPPLDSTWIFCSLPDALSVALTVSRPSELMSNETSICGSPRRIGGRPTSWKFPRSLLSAAISRSPWRTLMSTSCCPSTAVEKIRVFFVGIAVCFSTRRVNTPPRVSMPYEMGVTSTRMTSCILLSRTPPWMAAPMATASSGLTPLNPSLPKIFLTISWTIGIRVMPPTSRTCVSLDGSSILASLRHTRHGSTVLSTKARVSDSSFARVSFELRCLGPEALAVMNGRLISVCVVDESSHLARSAASRRRCIAMRSLERSMPCSRLNSESRCSVIVTSKSSPPRNVSPLVARTSNTPFWISRIEMSNVPPPRS